MGWLFGRKKEPESAEEMLRRYNDEQAARLSAVGAGELTVDDVFSITGRGTIATGKVTFGVLRVGDRINIVRDGATVSSTEIAGIEMFRKRATEASPGATVGILLRHRVDVASGDVIRASASS